MLLFIVAEECFSISLYTNMSRSTKSGLDLSGEIFGSRLPLAEPLLPLMATTGEDREEEVIKFGGGEDRSGATDGSEGGGGGDEEWRDLPRLDINACLSKLVDEPQGGDNGSTTSFTTSMGVKGWRCISDGFTAFPASPRPPVELLDRLNQPISPSISLRMLFTNLSSTYNCHGSKEFFKVQKTFTKYYKDFKNCV